MTSDVVTGITGVLAGGVCNGSWIAPMKRLTHWQWENSWLVYSITALFLLPWVVGFAVTPDLPGIYASSTATTLAKVSLYGLGWGIGSVLFGLGVARMGMAVGIAIILGLIAPIGTFYPLIALHPDELWTGKGRALMIGTAVVIAGILLLARAGGLRHEALNKDSTGPKRSSFAVGLVICVLSGLLSPMLNFALVFGDELQSRALSQGVSAALATNAVWPLALTAGGIANLAYAVFLLNRNRTWRLLADAPAGHWAGGALMGLLWYTSFLVYGLSATVLGPLGTVIGWPLFMAMGLITSSILGALAGEWKGAPRKAWAYSMAGMALLIVAITIIARG